MKSTLDTKKVVDIHECCVLCQRATKYTINTPVHQRRFYLEGGGQLCEPCFKQIQLQKQIENLERGDVVMEAFAPAATCAAPKSGAVILPYEKVGEYYVEQLGEVDPKPVYSCFKRLFDVVASGCALILLAIPMLIIAIAIKCTSPGTVFYKQERLGLNGQKFSVIKFRSMRMDAEAGGAQWSAGDNDPRITKLGTFLRKTRLDEVPQFWCILTGTMSLVGPRPEREVFYEEFETYVHGFRERLKVKPGLTGLAQVSGGYDLKPEEKIVYDIEYIKKRSFLLDLKIMFQTVAVVFLRRGAK